MKNALNPRVLVLALSTALLTACGGGGGGGGGSNGGGNTGGGNPTPADPYPEPTSAAYDEVELKGFYDIDASGATRAVRNDLAGNLMSPSVVTGVSSPAARS